jgi:hypothetical protein
MEILSSLRLSKLSVLIFKDQAGLQQAVDQHQPEAGHHHLHGAHEDHAPGTAQYNKIPILLK